jgi:hypothetical protein
LKWICLINVFDLFIKLEVIMTITPSQQAPEASTVQKRKEEMKADQEKAVNEKAAQKKAQMETEWKPAAKNEKQGNKLDVTA